ncbi:sugar ABC transporter permease [Clostridium sp. MB40-C1]|uniref:carbohydrate ABC transporter permease n=1 Tax=Clostridium sp. MB40-C1 TaxID=3070996 RepID=UPI0027E02C60|nr:sugar ABC transporter permease [Clostridium sp. MB40-C1]WMJ82415.1 sugar ABC transporter permease [Clostridium sp. MB40-C1]
MKSNKKNSNKENLKAFKFLAPSLISMFILSIIPILLTIFIAFTNYNLKTVNTGWKFVGLDNFKNIINGPLKEIFMPVFGWTIVSATLITIGSFALGLIFAKIVSNKNLKEASIYKALLIIPWALPASIIIIAFEGLLNSQYGAINECLMQLHLIKEPIMWLTEAGPARIAVILISIWIGFPYMMNVCIGGLSAIPDTYYEAADIDGASRMQKFFKITLPCLAKTTYPLLIGSWSMSFGNAGVALLLFKGGPVRANSPFAGYTDILASSAYSMSTKFGRFELAATLSIIMFVIVGVISFIQMRASGQFKEVD